MNTTITRLLSGLLLTIATFAVAKSEPDGSPTPAGPELTLKIAADGSVTVEHDGKPVDVLRGTPKIRLHMRHEFERDKLRTKPADWEKGIGRSVVILKIDDRCTWKMINEVMQGCRQAGYSNFTLSSLKAADQSNP